jgi:transposase
MKKLTIASHFSDKCLKRIMNSQSDIVAFKGWQIIYCVQTHPGETSEAISKMLGVSKSMIFGVLKKYNLCGKNWYFPKQRGGRREKRCYLSLEEEKIMMKAFEEDALSGNVLNFRRIKKKVEERVGKEVSDDYIWDLFSRHNWNKTVPRQSHPKADKVAQEEFKKNSLKIWQPNR